MSEEVYSVENDDIYEAPNPTLSIWVGGKKYPINGKISWENVIAVARQQTYKKFKVRAIGNYVKDLRMEDFPITDTDVEIIPVNTPAGE